MLVRVLAVLGVAALVVFGLAELRRGYIEQGVQMERERQREEAAAQLRESLRLGSQLAATARAEAQSARDLAGRLQKDLRRDRTLVAGPVACAAAGAAFQPEPDRAAAPGGTGIAAPGPPDVPARLPADAGLRLTAGAVRLWDSALAAADVPAGACRSDDPASAACAAATAITVDDAWDNHIDNASRCAVNRINHQRLIDFLNQREQATR